MNHAIAQRLRFIDFLLAHYGHFNRRALMDFHGVSKPQASIDIQAYLRVFPCNAEYDRSRKAYVRSATFKRAFP